MLFICGVLKELVEFIDKKRSTAKQNEKAGLVVPIDAFIPNSQASSL
jgi:hypothetical protein